MNYPRTCCSCKGIRTCSICENLYDIQKNFRDELSNLESFVYCPMCDKLIKGWDVNEVMRNHHLHKPEDGIPFEGFYVQTNFINSEEESVIMKNVDESQWDESQSGRRKQNFGPKVNFKKKKIAKGNFNGFPSYTKFVQDKFKDIPLLSDFKTIELCFLEYTTEKGAHIDKHIDDCWVWGERVVTVNCLSDSVLSLIRHKVNKPQQYNLDLVAQYEDSLISKISPTNDLLDDKVVIRVPMPRLSLLVMYGQPRYKWEHFILKEDIDSRRVCIAYREFTKMYLPNGSDFEKSKEVLEVSENYW